MLLESDLEVMVSEEMFELGYNPDDINDVNEYWYKYFNGLDLNDRTFH